MNGEEHSTEDFEAQLEVDIAQAEADIAAGTHYSDQCYVLICGGSSYDPCSDARERDENENTNRIADRLADTQRRWWEEGS